MDFHDELRSKFGAAVVGSCRKRGCALSFKSLDHHPTVIDADKYAALTGHRGKICDYLVFPVHPKIIVVAPEMKAGRVDVSHAVKQLAAGAAVAAAMTEGRENVLFRAVLLSGAIHTMEFRLLRSEKVSFRGQKVSVIRETCGVSLSAVIPELSSS